MSSLTGFKVGDRVKVDSFEGIIENLSSHRGGLLIRQGDACGYYHEIFPKAYGGDVAVTKVEPPRPEHQIVRDYDGDVFIYEPSESTDDPWRLVSKSTSWGDIGVRYEDDVLTPPLTVL